MIIFNKTSSKRLVLDPAAKAAVLLEGNLRGNRTDLVKTRLSAERKVFGSSLKKKVNPREKN